MNYLKYTQQQYILNVLRQSTLIIFSPKVIKKTLLFDVYEKMRHQEINLQLVNTKFVKNLINDSKFNFLLPLLNGPIIMAFSNTQTSYSDLVNLITTFDEKLTFSGALLNNSLFITQKRLQIIKSNPNNKLIIFFLIYNIYILTLVSRTR